MGTKQTAVEWLFEKITQNGEIRWRGTQYLKLFEQAKAMEKEQIHKAYESGCIGEVFELNCNHSSEQYYNETYGK